MLFFCCLLRCSLLTRVECNPIKLRIMNGDHCIALPSSIDIRHSTFNLHHGYLATANGQRLLNPNNHFLQNSLIRQEKYK